MGIVTLICAPHPGNRQEAGFASRRGGGLEHQSGVLKNYTGALSEFTLKSDNQGRILLPSLWRQKTGIQPATELFATITEEGGLILETREQGLLRARALLRKYIPEGTILSDELVDERRAEAANERER